RATPAVQRRPETAGADMTDLIPLARAHCLPRRGAEHRLTEARIRALLPEVPDWTLAEDGKALLRTFRFPDYRHTISFVNALAHTANREAHHPHAGVHDDRCGGGWSTHDVGGLGEGDFTGAARTDEPACGPGSGEAVEGVGQGRGQRRVEH